MISEFNHNNLNISVEKSADIKCAIVGDYIQYNITVINRSDKFITDVMIIDTLDSALEFEVGSVVVCGNKDINKNIIEGINLGCLEPNSAKAISFKAKILYKPCNSCINNNALAQFYFDCNYEVDNTDIVEIVSNIVTVIVEDVELKIIKDADKQLVLIGDKILYNVLIKNIGSLEAKSVFLLDKLPDELEIVPNTLKINGQTINYYNNNMKVYIGNIRPMEIVQISYETILKKSNCNASISNLARAMFTFNLCNNTCLDKRTRYADSNISKIKIAMNNFKELSIDKEFCLACGKPDIYEINSLDANVIITESNIIRTPKITSNEGQKLTGYKLIVSGFLNEIIEYTANNENQSIHSECYKVPFSSFIILPDDYKIGSNLFVNSLIEDIEYTKIGERRFFSNVSILINVKIACC